MIVSLYLKSYIPLTFCGVNEVTYYPKALLQIIIGTNGSGKSSLLRALSLAPLDKTEFLPGGQRVLEVNFRENKYKLISHYKSGSPHHEFWVNEENLNPGGTSAVQKQLTESHFGYTAFHHKLLTGKLAFTEMSPNARKDLLVMISGLELDYGIERFDKIRVVHRDIIGAMKHLTSKYSDTAKQLAAMESVDELEDQAKTLNEELVKLIPKTNYSVDRSGTTGKLRLLSKKIEELYRRYTALNRTLKKLCPDYKTRDGVQLKDMEMLTDRASLAAAQIADIETKISKHLTEHSQLEEQASKFANVPDGSSRAQYQAEVDKLTSELSAIPVCEIQNVSDLNSYAVELLECHSSILNFMETFPEVPTFYTTEESSQVREKYQDLNAKYSSAKSYSDSVGMKITHAEAAREGNVKCPKCDEEILASGALSLERIAQLKSKKAEADKTMESVETELKEVNKVLEKIDYFSKTLVHVREIAKRYPLARNIFAKDGPKYFIEFPREMLSKVHGELEAVNNEIRRKELQASVDEKKLLLSLMDMNGKEKILSRFKQVEEELDTFYRMKQELEEEQKYTVQIRDILQEMNSYMTVLESKYYPEYESLVSQLTKDIGDENLNQLVSHKQNRLAQMNKTINDYRLVTNKLKELEQEEKELASRKQKLEILLHCLSPKKGIIGQQLYAVITGVSLSINEIVDEVWEKEMLLVPPEFGKTLDFKFLTQIEGKQGPDIKDLSDGQKEIVNFAMTLVIMRQLDLLSFPLLLDETSANMDPVHRGNFMKYVRELVDTGEFSSIFLVSHYASEYGGFTNADMVIMNPDNIGIPAGDHNQNIVLK